MELDDVRLEMESLGEAFVGFVHSLLDPSLLSSLERCSSSKVDEMNLQLLLYAKDA